MLGRMSVLLVLAALLGGAGTVGAAPKSKPKAAKPAAPKPGAAKPKKGKEAAREKDQEQDAGKEQDKPDESSAAADAKNASKEESVKGTTSSKGPDTSSVKVKEDKEGVKTYKFETVEVEGRLKSPQVIYFLRRVRAEFDAGALGHRSFLGELSDSRRSAAFR